MSDYISREELKRKISNWNFPSVLWDIVNDLPSADVRENIHGEWEIYIISMLDGEGCKCSECGFEGVPYWNYCPNCGADMRGET